MTTIAFDGYTLAADRRMGGDRIVHKISKVPEGWAAGCGDASLVIEVIEWLKMGSPRDALPDLPEECYDEGTGRTEIIVINPKGKCYRLTWPYLRPIPMLNAYIAIGSGGEYAMGAMAYGATDKEAVQIASKFDKGTGFGIDTVQIRKRL